MAGTSRELSPSLLPRCGVRWTRIPRYRPGARGSEGHLHAPALRVPDTGRGETAPHSVLALCSQADCLSNKQFSLPIRPVPERQGSGSPNPPRPARSAQPGTERCLLAHGCTGGGSEPPRRLWAKASALRTRWPGRTRFPPQDWVRSCSFSVLGLWPALALGSVRWESQGPAHYNLHQLWGKGLENADSRATPIL